jgi:hypothetical protein
LFKQNIADRDDSFYERSKDILKQNDLVVIFGRVHAEPLYDKFKGDSSVDRTLRILSMASPLKTSANAAMAVPGGIDLTSKRMKLEVDSDKSAVAAPMDLKALENIEINGLYIKTIEIKPLNDLPELLGVSAG